MGGLNKIIIKFAAIKTNYSLSMKFGLSRQTLKNIIMKTKHFILITVLILLGVFTFTQCSKDDTEASVVAPPSSSLKINPVDADFGAQEISTETSMVFTVTNTNDKPNKISSISLEGANKTAFTTNAEPTSVAANSGTYQFKVNFVPKTKGAKNAAIRLVDETGTIVIQLKGIANEASGGGTTPQDDMGKDTKVMFLHHSTGQHIWGGGVSDWFSNYNGNNETNYTIHEEFFPRDGYPWSNNPYDYWNIWINHAGNSLWENQKTLEILSSNYDVIVWKHCFPVSHVAPSNGNPDISSEYPSIDNYKLQYNALKAKMKSYPNNRFIVWTGAVEVESELTEAQAIRAKAFFTWVKEVWDEAGDNIYVWDFYTLETEGGLYLKPEYAYGSTDSHPNASFSNKVAPFFSKRIVDVIQGKGDTGSITGE